MPERLRRPGDDRHGSTVERELALGYGIRDEYLVGPAALTACSGGWIGGQCALLVMAKGGVVGL